MANIQGSSLIPDLTSVQADIAAFQDRRRAASKEASLEEDLRIALGGAPADAKPTRGLSVLGQLAPQLAQAANALLGNRNPQATTSFRAEAIQGKALAETIQNAPNFAAQQKLLADEVGTVAAQGGDVTRLVDLANMNESQLDLELQRMQVIADGMLKAVPAVKPGETLNIFSTPTRRNAFARVAAANPAIAGTLLASRDRQIARSDRLAREQAATRAAAATARAAAAAPQTDLGKTIAAIKSDVANGVIGADIGDQLITQERANAVAQAPPEFQSAVGKLVGDVEAATEIYGADSLQVNALNDALLSARNGERPKLNEVGGIRKEFAAQSGEFVTLRNAFGKIRTAAQIANEGDSAAADLSMIFSYMKMLDPGSVVRESEFATAENARGVPETIRNLYNRVTTGERLSDDQRNDFLNVATQIFNTSLKDQNNLIDQFTGIATRNGIDPRDVVVDYIGDSDRAGGQEILEFDNQGQLIK